MTQVTAFHFSNRDSAWSFVRLCENDGVITGLPTLGSEPTVKVKVTDLEIADRVYDKLTAAGLT